MNYNAKLVLNVSDESALESSARTFLQSNGRTDAEIQDILYDGDDFQPTNAITSLYTPDVVYSGIEFIRLECFAEGDD